MLSAVQGSAAIAAGASAIALEGVTIVRTDPLAAGPLAMAALPEIVEIGTSTGAHFARDFDAAGWAVQRVGLGFARIDLGGYRLTVDDVRAELVLDNVVTGTSARIWGDAMFEARGDAVGQFWGTTSLELDDGLFITCGTAQSNDNPNLYRLDRLTITKGSNAVVVAAIGGDAGDMTLTGTERDRYLEEDTADGLVLVEQGGDWLTEDRSAAADAEYLMQTAPGGYYGPGEGGWSDREFGRMLSRFVQTMIGNSSWQNIDAHRVDLASDTRRHDDMYAALVRADQRRMALVNSTLHKSVEQSGMAALRRAFA